MGTDLWGLTSGKRRIKRLDDWMMLEQGFLTVYFDNGKDLESVGGGCGVGWRKLPGKYNFCVRYVMRQQYDGLTPVTTSLVHFAMAKPWDRAHWMYVPAPYVQLYLTFVIAAGVPWNTTTV